MSLEATPPTTKEAFPPAHLLSLPIIAWNRSVTTPLTKGHDREGLTLGVVCSCRSATLLAQTQDR